MSRLIWDQLKIRNNGTSAGDASEIVISNIVTEGIEVTGDGKITIEIRNKQPVTEGYNRGFTVQAREVNDDSGTAILSDANVFADPATDTLQLATIELAGGIGATTLTLNDVYIMGENTFDERLGVSLSAQLETISDPIIVS